MIHLSNARVFNGSELLPGTRTVSIDNGLVAAISDQPPATAGDNIDLAGMTLMPGLISCHLHPEFYRFTLAHGQAGERPGMELPPGVLMAIAVRTCGTLLDSGFTGYVGAACAHNIDAQLKMAITDGIMAGPRIRACSHHIGTTADLNDSPVWWKSYRQDGIDLFADGPDALRKLVREEIRCGAQTIKVFASSGRGFNGRTMRNISNEELTTIVNSAHDLGARVRAHVCDNTMIRECIEAGVDIIDHGDEIDEYCIDAMAKAGTFWVPSLTYSHILLQLGWDTDGTLRPHYDNEVAMLPVAQQAGVKILIGDDYSGVFREILDDDPLDHQVGCYGREFDFYSRLTGLAPEAILSWGTRNAGELLVDAPQRVGVIEPGAIADLIAIDGDPTRDLSLLARPEKALKMVMRDGVQVIDRIGTGV